MLDVCADAGWLGTTLSVVNLIQCIMQARWVDDPSLLTLPHADASLLSSLEAARCVCLPQLVEGLAAGGQERARLVGAIEAAVGPGKAKDVVTVAERMPLVAVSVQKPVRQGGETVSGSKTGELVDSDASTSSSGWEITVSLERLRGAGARSGGRGGAGAKGSQAAAAGEEPLAVGRQGSGRPRVYAPRFPKLKEEGWYLVVGDTSTRELLALKRVSLVRAWRNGHYGHLEELLAPVRALAHTHTYTHAHAHAHAGVALQRAPAAAGDQRRGAAARRGHSVLDE
jgi:activating signal cointegrator complex subunit 3